jgi:hypothetical protein
MLLLTLEDALKCYLDPGEVGLELQFEVEL